MAEQALECGADGCRMPTWSAPVSEIPTPADLAQCRTNRRKRSAWAAMSSGFQVTGGSSAYLSKFHSNGYRGTLSVNSAEILGPLKYELRNMSYELRSRQL